MPAFLAVCKAVLEHYGFGVSDPALRPSSKVPSVEMGLCNNVEHRDDA